MKRHLPILAVLGLVALLMTDMPHILAATTLQQDDATRQMVDALVDQWLEGEDAEEALRQLHQLGPVAIPHLQQLMSESPDREARRRLAELIKEIDAAAPASGMFQQTVRRYPFPPSGLTIELKNASFEQAMARLSEVTGLRIGKPDGPVDPPRRWPSLVANVNLRDAGINEVFDSISSAFGGSIVVRNGELSFQPRGPSHQGMLDRSEWKAIKIDSLHREQVLRLDDPENPLNTLFATVSLLIDPRVQIASELRCVLEQAEDNHGNSLVPDETTARQYTGNPGARSFSIPLSYPRKNVGDRVRILKGAFVAEVVTEMSVLRLDDLTKARNVSAEVGDWTYRMIDFVQQSDKNTFELRLRVQRKKDAPAMNTDEWNRFYTGFYRRIYNAIKVTDANGQALRNRGGGGHVETGKRLIEQSLSLGAPDDKSIAFPLSLQLELPSQVEPLRVPFEFTDLPMP